MVALEKEIWYLTLPHQKIVDLICVLEGYEGLAAPRVLDKEREIVELLVAPDLAAELEEVISGLETFFPVSRVSRPEGVGSIADDD